MSDHTDRIKEKILDHIPSMEADALGHKFGTMHRSKVYHKVCINCGCLKRSGAASRPCEPK